MQNIDEFIEENKDNIFLMNEYRHNNIFTPYEVEHKAVDESHFTDYHSDSVKIIKAIQIGSEVYLQILKVDEDDDYEDKEDEKIKIYEYKNIKDISLYRIQKG